MYARILVPTDGSACSDAAVEHALEIAKAMRSTVVFLFALDTLSVRREGVLNIEEARATLAAQGEPFLRRAERAAQNAGVQAERDLAEGAPADVIVQRAAQCDLVVMGSHGKELWRWVTIGSVTRSVLHRVTRPVLVVRGRPVSPAFE